MGDIFGGLGGVIGGALGLGGSVIGGEAQASAADQAAKLQLQAAQEAIAEQQRQFNLIQQNFQPYLQTGAGAVGQLGQLFGAGGDAGRQAAFTAFQNYPGYQFSYQQGLRGLDQSAAARGLLLSGGQLQGAQRFGQGLASTQFNNYYNQLLQLAGLGQASAGHQASAGIATGQGIAQNLLQGGQAAASGIVGGANALAGSLSGGIQNAILFNALSGSPVASPAATAQNAANQNTINSFDVGNFLNPNLGVSQ